jgi:hypothetical protein
MTQLEIVRTALLDEISRIKRGTTSTEDSMAIVKCANALTNTYNTEIKAFGTILTANDAGVDINPVKVFEPTTKLVE